MDPSLAVHVFEPFRGAFEPAVLVEEAEVEVQDPPSLLRALHVYQSNEPRRRAGSGGKY